MDYRFAQANVSEVRAAMKKIGFVLLMYCVSMPVLAAEPIDIREGTSIRGATELPKVLYIVPWKKSGVGDVLMQPGSSLFSEELSPIDRDVFRRQVNYYEMMRQGSTTQR